MHKIGKHRFCFNPNDSSGESVLLVTEFFEDGCGEIFTNQEFSLQCYGTAKASINLYGCQITPGQLRDLANSLEKYQNSMQHADF